MNIYAVKYLDENGYVKGYGYINYTGVEDLKPGDILTDWAGNRMVIDFKPSPGAKIW